MAGLRELYNKLKGLTKKQVEDDLFVIVLSESSAITQLNKNQLLLGETSEGGELPPYSKKSVEVHGKRPGPWQLFDTGDFQSRFFIDPAGFPVSIFSADDKTSKILKMLSDRGARNPYEIFGISKTNTEKVITVLKPKTTMYFRDLLSV